MLPAGAYVINTARGPCIDLTALRAALDSRHIAFAGLDVVEREPLDDEDLRRHPCVLLTPHVGGSTSAFPPRAKRLLSAQLGRFAAGQPVQNVMTET